MRTGTGEGEWYQWLEPPSFRSFPTGGPPPLDRIDGQLWYGRVDLRLECLSPVHVGTGAHVVVGSQLVQEMTRHAGTPIIPGSSLKGVVRSVVEALTGGCAPNRVRCLDTGTPCAACSLFGWVAPKRNQRPNRALGTSQRGRVGFDDLVLEGDPEVSLEVIRIPPMYSPQRVGQGRKFYLHRHQVESGLVPVEVARPGSTFLGAMWLDGVSDRELSLLAFALGLDGTFALKVGGGKSAFLGSVRLTVTGEALRRGGDPMPVRDWPKRAAELPSVHPAVRQAADRLRSLWSWDEPRGRSWEVQRG